MRKTTAKAVSVIMAVSLALGLFAVLPRAAGAADISKPSFSAAANLGGTEVYFGSYTGGASAGPILWHVVETGSGTATLWTTTSMGDRQYHAVRAHQYWSESDICVWLNGTSGGQFLNDAFKTAEQAAITEYGTTEQANPDQGITTPIDINQKIVLPSVAEIGYEMGTGTWGIAYTGGRRGFGNTWWLRSPGYNTLVAAVVNDVGYVEGSGIYVDSFYAIRPALKLNLAFVIFTSAAAGGKSGAVGAALSAAQPPTGAVKLTVLESDTSKLSLNSAATSAGTVKAGDTVSIPYTDAVTGPNKYVSCIIEGSGGTVLFYGKLATAASGTASFTVPAAAQLPDGSYTIKLFNEECDADYYTDFASTPVSIAMRVGNPRPASALPKTGDGFPMGGLLALLGMCLAGMGWMGFRMRGRRTRA